MKKLGTTLNDLVDVYFKQIRSILELAVPAWEPGLTQLESNQIERVQKTALYVILGNNYGSYRTALDTMKCETLSDRRQDLCMNFSKKAYNHPRFSNWFSLKTTETSPPNTRSDKRLTMVVYPVNTRTVRYAKSPIPYLTDLLNMYVDNIK